MFAYSPVVWNIDAPLVDVTKEISITLAASKPPFCITDIGLLLGTKAEFPIVGNWLLTGMLGLF